MKLENTYELADLPEPFITSPDIELYIEDEETCLSFFKHLKSIGAGEIYTQVDNPINDATLYARGTKHITSLGYNPTGSYAFVFGVFE